MSLKQGEKLVKIVNIALTTSLLIGPLLLSSLQTITYAQEKIEKVVDNQAKKEDLSEDSKEEVSSSDLIMEKTETLDTEIQNKVEKKPDASIKKDEKMPEELIIKEDKKIEVSKPIKKIEEATFRLSVEEEKAELVLIGKVNINDVYKYTEELAPITKLIIKSENEGDFDIAFLANSMPLKQLEYLEASEVCTIPGRAFQKSKIKELFLPKTKKIATKAFEQNQLTSVVLPEVEKLEGTVFYNNQLTMIEIPKIKEIGSWALKGNQLTELEFIELEKISDEAFGDNPLESVKLPKAKNVNTTAFKNVSSIKQAEIGGSDGTFKNLSALFLPSKESLKKLTITKMRNIKKGTENDEWFSGWKIKMIHLPEVRTIDEYGFNQSSFTSIEIPNIEEIKANAFANSQIQKLELPPTVRMISEDAFKSSALELVTFREDKKERLLPAFKKAPAVLGMSEAHIGNKKIELNKSLSIPMASLINEGTAKSTIQSEWWKDQSNLAKQESSSLEIKKASSSDQGVYQGKMTIHSSTDELLLAYDSNLFNVSVGKYLASPKVEKITEKDYRLTGTGIAEATIKAMVEGQEIGNGVVKPDGSFSFAIPQQTKGTTIKVVQAIAGEESEEVTVKVEFLIEMTTFPRGNPQTNKETEKRGFSHASMEPTGIFLPKNEELIINVEEEPENTSVKIGQWGSYNEDNPYISTEKKDFLTEKLHKGKNVFKRDDSGGMVYIDNRSESQHVGITIEGGTQVPYYKQGTTSLEEFKAQLETNPNVPFLEMVSDNVIGTFQIHRAKDLLIPGNRVNELLDYWELVVKLQNEVSGLDFNVEGVNKKHNDRIHITNPDTGAGAAFATEYRVAVHTNSDRNLLTYRPDEKQWLIWHEIGHTYQNQYYKWSGLTEVTVNIQSEYIQQKLFGTNRIEGPEYAKNIHNYLTKPIEKRNFDKPGEEYGDFALYIKLAMFWNLQRVFGDDFYPALNQSYRLLPKDQLPKTDDEKKQTFMKMTSRVVKRNLTPYFEEFGLKVEEETKKELSQYSDLEKEIWKDVGFGERQQIPGLVQEYSIPTADVDDAIVPIFTSENKLASIIKVSNPHSVPIASNVTIEKIDAQYTGYGKQTQVAVWLKNELGYKDKMIVNLDATPADTVHFRGNNGASIIVGPNVEEKNFKTVVKKGKMHGSAFVGREYLHLTLLNGNASKEKGKAIANGDTKAEDFAEQLEKLTYEVGDVIEIYHAESSIRLDRYLNNDLLTPDNEKTYLYRITEQGWEPLLNLKAPEVSMVTERDQIINGTGEPGATVTAKVDVKSIGIGKVGTDSNFSIKINPQKANTKITVEQTIDGITSPSSEVIVESMVDIKTDLISKMVSDQLKIDQTHTFTGSQISKITNLKISNNPEIGKEEIKDISKLVSLTNLELPNNKIESITDLSSLTKLTKLDISKNQIKDISAIAAMTDLTTLYLNENQINSVSQLSGLTELTTLYINNNMIENIDALEKMTKLKWLNLSENKIRDIQSLNKMTELLSLKVENNQVENIKILANMKALTELKLTSNNIKNVEAVADLMELKKLWLSENKINEISLSKLDQLEFLSLKSNNIEDIQSLGSLTNLKEVWLSNNKIKDLSPIQNVATIKSAKNQQIIVDDQENNDGTVVLPNVIVEKGLAEGLGTFSYRPSNQGSYQADTNQLIWKNIGSYELSYTFASENGLYTGTVTVPLKGRDEKVKIKSDLIAEMIAKQLKVEVTHEYSKEQLSKITSLNLNNNEAFVESDLEDVAKLTNMKSLYIENLSIKDLSPLSSLKYLEILGIRGNKVESLSPLSPLIHLKEIYGTNGSIKDIEGLKELKNLTKLWLGKNKLTTIDALKNLTNLSSLSLEHNQIQDVSSLSSLTNLTELFLYNNQISDLGGISTKSIIKDARNQTITLKKQKVVDGQLILPNVVQLNGINELGNFSATPSNSGEYKVKENTINWFDLNELKLPKSLSYQFSFGEGKIYSGKVVVPIGLEVEELEAPGVNSVLSTDKVISGKAEAKATVVAKVADKEIGTGEAKLDGTFELSIEPQKVGTKISVTQTVDGCESPATEVTVEKAEIIAYNTYKLGYWRDYGFVLEGQAGIAGQVFSSKEDVVKTVELVNTENGIVEVTSTGVNTNWYNPSNYDGYQAIITNEMFEKLVNGNYRLQIKLNLQNGETVTQNLTGTQSQLFGFIGEYQDSISGLGMHGIGEKVLQFNEGLGQVLLNISQGLDQVNVINSRMNASGDNIADLWIASNEYDYQNNHTKYLVIKDEKGKEVYNKKAPTWDIKKTFRKQVKAEWEKSGVQAIIPKEYKGSLFIKEIQVKDKEGEVQVTTKIPQEYLK